jgi:3-oxoacyl-ACP reductase-like protein
MTEAEAPAPASPGPGDRLAIPSDPTQNVLDLVRAESRYQDGMRQMFKELVEARLNGIRELADLRAQHQAATATAEARRVDEQAALRAGFSEKLSVAEASRIDAIRAVDVAAVAVASQRASDQAIVLANQVAQSAEALRTLVASTANTVAQSQQVLSTTLSTRITTLEQAQYEGKGRSAFADPAFAELLNEVKRLSQESIGDDWSKPGSQHELGGFHRCGHAGGRNRRGRVFV